MLCRSKSQTQLAYLLAYWSVPPSTCVRAGTLKHQRASLELISNSRARARCASHHTRGSTHIDRVLAPRHQGQDNYGNRHATSRGENLGPSGPSWGSYVLVPWPRTLGLVIPTRRRRATGMLLCSGPWQQSTLTPRGHVLKLNLHGRLLRASQTLTSLTLACIGRLCWWHEAVSETFNYMRLRVLSVDVVMQLCTSRLCITFF